MGNKTIELTYKLPNRKGLSQAGVASSGVKKALSGMGIDKKVIRRVAIAMYEAEINAVIHGNGGEALAKISEDKVVIQIKDRGVGIPDVKLAMTEGFSTASENVRAMGFGAGMGLPNIKRYADELEIKTEVGKGTTITITVYLNKD